MSSVQIGQKSYEMPPREGMSIAHFLTVADIERSAHYYEKIFGARILSLGDGNAPAYLQLANIWMILNVGGAPTEDKPTVTLSVPARPAATSAILTDILSRSDRAQTSHTVNARLGWSVT
jgi:hypothetical protein